MQDLLDLSKIEAGEDKPQLVSLRARDVIGGAAEGLRPQVEAKGLALRVETPVDLPSVLADRTQIERVIRNLVTNAIRHTKQGEIGVSAERRGEFVAVSVSDTGSGVPKEYLTHIFDKFVQVPGATTDGAGLGLAISRSIVEAHGGQISVQSEVDGARLSHSLCLSLVMVQVEAGGWVRQRRKILKNRGRLKRCNDHRVRKIISR